jgi:hypothetical protein
VLAHLPALGMSWLQSVYVSVCVCAAESVIGDLLQVWLEPNQICIICTGMRIYGHGSSQVFVRSCAGHACSLHLCVRIHAGIVCGKHLHRHAGGLRGFSQFAINCMRIYGGKLKLPDIIVSKGSASSFAGTS